MAAIYSMRLAGSYTTPWDTIQPYVQMLAETEHERGNTQQRGNMQRAVALVRENLPRTSTRREGSSDRPHLLCSLAGFLVAMNDVSGAVGAAREAIELLATRDPDSAIIAIAVEHVAIAWSLQGDLLRVATLQGYADAAFQRYGGQVREFVEMATYNRLTAILREGPAPGATRTIDLRRVLR